MRLLFLVLALGMAARSFRLVRAGQFRRWLLLAFWVCFGVAACRSWTHLSTLLCAGLLLAWVCASVWKYVYIVALLGPLLLGWRVRPLLRRWRGSWAAVLRGRPWLLVYRDGPVLSGLIESRLLPSLAARAVVIRLPSRRTLPPLRSLDAWAYRAVPDVGRVPVLLRLRLGSPPVRYDLRPLLWQFRNGRPGELERLLAVVRGRAA